MVNFLLNSTLHQWMFLSRELGHLNLLVCLITEQSHYTQIGSSYLCFNTTETVLPVILNHGLHFLIYRKAEYFTSPSWALSHKGSVRAWISDFRTCRHSFPISCDWYSKEKAACAFLCNRLSLSLSVCHFEGGDILWGLASNGPPSEHNYIPGGGRGVPEKEQGFLFLLEIIELMQQSLLYMKTSTCSNTVMCIHFQMCICTGENVFHNNGQWISLF